MFQLSFPRVAALAAGAALLSAASVDAAPAPLRGVDAAATWVTGDVNGDGRADLPGRPSGLGVTFATATTDVRNDPSGPGLDLRPAVGETLGAVSDAGDFDGDGFDDLLVTAQRGGAALVYVVHGASAPATLTVAAGPRVTAIGLAVPFQFGVGPRSIGDFNGDGKDDVVVGRQTGTTLTASGWTGGYAIVMGGAPGATINANSSSARTLVINASKSCSYILTTYLCGVSAIEVDPVGDVSGDGRADVFVEGSRADRRYTLLGRTTTGTFSAATLPSSGAVRAPAFLPTGRVFAAPAGDVNADGLGDFTVLAKVSDATTTPQRRLVVLGTRATTGIAQAGPSMVSSGQVGAAELVDDLTGDGRRDLVVLTKTDDNSGYDDNDPSSWDERLFRVSAKIASIPAGATGTFDLDAAPAIAGLPEAGYTQYSGSLFGLRVADVEGDARLELAISLTDRLLLASATSADRLAPELFNDADAQLKGVSLPNAAINPGSGAPRGLRMREAGTLTLEYRRTDGSLAGTEDVTLPSGTTRDTWRATVGGATLPNGSYTLRATPRDGAGNRGATQTTQLVISSGSTAATIEVEPRFTNPDGSLITPGGGSYRLNCASGDGPNGTVVGGDNGVSTPVDLSEFPWPPSAGTSCELRFNFFAGDKWPAECGTRPTTVRINGQPVAVAEPMTVTFTVQPGANRIVHERGCTPPVFDGSRTVTAYTGPDWIASGTSGHALVLTNGPNQTGGRLFPFPIDPNRRTYEFKVTMANGNGQAEGVTLAFVKPKDSAASGGFPGSGGGALGVGGLQGTFIAIDQRQGPGDTRASGVGIADGATATGLNWLQTADPGQLIRGRGAVPIKVVANGTTVAIYVNGSLRLTRTMTLPSPAFLAVSGSTSSIWQNQTISDLKVTP